MQTKYRRIKAGLLAVLVMLLIGCTSSGGTMTIDGKALTDNAKKIDELNSEQVRISMTEKYSRHYEEGRYFMDLSATKAELQEKYDRYIESLLPYFSTHPIIVKVDVEFVNQSVIDYRDGQLSFEEMIANPGMHIMSLKGSVYTFKAERDIKYENSENYVDGKAVYQAYKDHLLTCIDGEVEYIEVSVKQYHSDLLKKVSAETIEQSDNAPLLLSSYLEYRTHKVKLNVTYHNLYSLKFNGPQIHDFPADEKNRYEEINEFREVYHKEVFQYDTSCYALVEAPSVIFGSIATSSDEYPLMSYFPNTYYQYLMNQRIRQILKEEGAEDKIVFFVETEPHREPHTDGLAFDLSTPEKEESFLRTGYNGDVNVVLNYLKDTEEEKMDYDMVYKVAGRISEHLGVYDGYIDRDFSFSGYKSIYLYLYQLDTDQQKIVIDLFNKHPLTERDRRPVLAFGEGLSQRYELRAETPGFHYLDIFGKKDVNHYSMLNMKKPNDETVKEFIERQNDYDGYGY